MEHKPYLTFSLHDLLYGVDALTVQEIIYLPELIPVVEAPADIVGIMNLRGTILPVMDLDIRFGHQPQNYSLSDSVIVLKWQDLRIGIIVSQVHEVKLIDSQAMEGVAYGRQLQTHSNFIAGVAKVETDLITLLNHQTLLHSSEATTAIATNGNGKGNHPIKLMTEAEAVTTQFLPSAQSRIFCPHATPEERAVFRERAENLMQSTESQDFAGLMPLAVIGLDGEYFGLDLEMVREFTDVRKVTPIPCCPSHIVGNMNLRGEIVTLVDIRSALNMTTSTRANAYKAMVVQLNDLIAGVAVDDVFDVMYFHPSDIKPVPTAVHAEGDEYLRGTTPYAGKMLSILELQKILTRGALVVHEEV